MACTLTARRLQPGRYEDVRSAWGGGSDERPAGTERWIRIYHCRAIADENVVVSFGFFDGSPSELREAQQALGRESQVGGLEPFVEEVLLDGSSEVIEELT